jgi:hypothetical protein
MPQDLRAVSTNKGDNWVQLMCLAEYPYNNAIHASTRMTPLFANYTCHLVMQLTPHISNNASLLQKHRGVVVRSDGSDETSYPLTQQSTLPIAQASGRDASVPPLLCAWDVVTYTHYQNDTSVTLLAVAAVQL